MSGQLPDRQTDEQTDDMRHYILPPEGLFGCIKIGRKDVLLSLKKSKHFFPNLIITLYYQVRAAGGLPASSGSRDVDV